MLIPLTSKIKSSKAESCLTVILVFLMFRIRAALSSIRPVSLQREMIRLRVQVDQKMLSF